MQNIIVTITSNYGVEAIYPVCEAAKTFARLAGTKTLTRSTIALIKNLGYQIDVQQDQVQL